MTFSITGAHCECLAEGCRATALYAEIEQLQARLEQIAIVCTDNMDRDCNHRMALDFVRQIANEQSVDPK